MPPESWQLCWLAGFAVCREESTELRSLELDDLTAAWAVRVARGGSALLGKAQFVANSRGTSLKIDGVEVATQSALLPDLLSKYQKTAEPRRKRPVSRSRGRWGGLSSTGCRFPAGASVETGDALILDRFFGRSCYGRSPSTSTGSFSAWDPYGWGTSTAPPRHFAARR